MSDWDRERAWQLCMELEQYMREAGVVTTAHYGRGQDVLAQDLAERDAYADELVAVRLTADATRDRLTAERDAARAELEIVKAERDALIAAWPEGHDRRCVYRTPYDVWCVAGGCGGRDPFRQRSDAVYAAAGLAPAEGDEHGE